jgi:hypothetical protein
MCFTKVVLPLPLTPVITLKQFKGTLTSKFFKLCWLQLVKVILLLTLRGCALINTLNSPLKYLPVKLFLFLIMLCNYLLQLLRHHVY